MDKTSSGWRARWRTPDGASRSKTFRRKIDAEKHLTAVEHTKLSGAYVDPAAGRVTLRAYGEAWTAARVSWKPATRLRYEVNLANHLYPAFGTRPLGSIRPTEVQELVADLTARLAPRTVQGVYRVLHALYGSAVRDRLVAANPCEHIDLPRAPKQDVTILTAAEVDALAQAIDPRHRTMVLLGAGAGLRISEALGLAVSGVDFLRRELRVTQQVVTIRGTTTLEPPKSPASVRTVPLADTVLGELAAHLSRHPVGPSGLWHSDQDAPIPTGRYEHRWATVAKRAGLAGTKYHALRHTFASALIASGCSVEAVRAALGHESAVTTLTTYAHLWPSDAERTRGAIDAFLDPRVSELCQDRVAKPS